MGINDVLMIRPHVWQYSFPWSGAGALAFLGGLVDSDALGMASISRILLVLGSRVMR